VVDTVMLILHWLAALIVLLEAMNKLERCAPLRPGLTPAARLVAVLKAVAWVPIALGAAGAVVRPALVAAAQPDPHIGAWLLVDRPSLVDLLYVIGFAVLITRERIKEHLRGAPT
jgi:hypothetical protein